MKKTSIIIFSILCISVYSQSNNPYMLSWKTDGSIAAYSTVGLGTFIIINNRVKPLSESDISSLNHATINSFDRNTTKKYSDRLAKTSDYAAFGSIALSVGIPGMIALLGSESKQEFWNQSTTLAALCIETNIVTALTTNIIKSSVLRTRPYVYHDNAPLSKKMEIHARKSFFSSHTALTAANTFFAAQVVSDYYPHSWQSYSTWTIAAIVPAIVGYLRIESGRHFPTDVLTGYLFGAACGIIIPNLHKQTPNNEQVQIGVAPNMVRVSISL